MLISDQRIGLPSEVLVVIAIAGNFLASCAWLFLSPLSILMKFYSLKIGSCLLTSHIKNFKLFILYVCMCT